VNRIALAVALLAPAAARAQKVDLSVTTMGASGVSATSGDGGTATRRSPLQLEFDVGAGFEPDPRWEWTGGLITEIEGRTSLGINPQIKRLMGGRRLTGYATAGVPAYFSPFTLLGFEVGGGVIARLTGFVSLALEVRADFFFVGSDLPEDGMLSKFDVALGVRLPL
jgi:hypothetical protein